MTGRVAPRGRGLAPRVPAPLVPVPRLLLPIVLAAAAASSCGDAGPPHGAAPAPTPVAGATSPAAGTTPISGTTPAAAPGWFTDVTTAAGLDFVHDAGRTEDKHLPETMGAGGLLADLDGDGDLDIYLVQGGPLPGLENGRPRPVNRLYLNDGRGRFTDATAQSGAAAHSGYGMGVAAGDVEGDGDQDLFVTNFGGVALLLNDGHAHFTDGTAAAGISDDRWTSAATFFDADADGDQDLYVTGYVQVDLTHPLWCGDHRPGWRSTCHPDAYAGLHPRYWRNRGDGTFEDATAAAGLATDDRNPGKGLGAIACDVDADGDLDLYVANDSVENRLWMNRGDGTFEDGTLLSGTGVDGSGRTNAGMGLASGDVDGDGDFELLVTNFDDESNTLYRNDGGGMFTDATAAAGLAVPSLLPVGFGVVLADLDNDGDLDLAVANGHIIDNIELYNDGKTWKQRSQVFSNDGHGRFLEETARSGDLGRDLLVGRGLYSGDVDGDGDLDLLLTQCGGPALLLANNGGPDGRPGGGAVFIDGLPPGTRATATTTDGRTLVREAGTQTSYFGGCAPALALGLGSAALERVVLRAPGRPPVECPLEPPVADGRLHWVPGEQGLQRPAVAPVR